MKVVDEGKDDIFIEIRLPNNRKYTIEMKANRKVTHTVEKYLDEENP